MFHPIVQSLHVPLHSFTPQVWTSRSYDLRSLTETELRTCLHSKSSWKVQIRQGSKQKTFHFRASTTLAQFLKKLKPFIREGYFENLELVGVTCLGTPVYEFIWS